MINWSRVEELRDEIGADDFDEVVQLFLEEVDEAIARLREGPDIAGIEADMHFLRGSSVNLGFEEFSGLCAVGERQAAAGNAGEVDIPHVLSTYDKSREMFMAELGNRFAA